MAADAYIADASQQDDMTIVVVRVLEAIGPVSSRFFALGRKQPVPHRHTTGGVEPLPPWIDVVVRLGKLPASRSGGPRASPRGRDEFAPASDDGSQP